MTAVLQSVSLIESLSAALRAEIISGAIPPGAQLTEAWVTEHFDVARPTAKSGLDRLISEGMLRRAPRRTSVVPKLLAEDVEDIYLSREPVESVAVARLAAEGVAPKEAQRALAMMRVAAEQNLHAEHTEADIDFHRALVAASASPRLRRMHETVMGEMQLCIAQVRRIGSVDLAALTASHADILAAIERADPDAAVEALRADLHGCRDTLLRDATRAHADEHAAQA